MDDERPTHEAPGDDSTSPPEPSAPTAPAPAPAAPSAPPPPPPPPPGAGQPVIYQVAQPTNGQAVAALVLGIVGVVLFWTIWLGTLLGILAIVFGAIGSSKAKQGAPNKGMATAGLVLGVVAVVASVLFIVFLVAIANDANDVFDQIQFCVDHPDDPMC